MHKAMPVLKPKSSLGGDEASRTPLSQIRDYSKKRPVVSGTRLGA